MPSTLAKKLAGVKSGTIFVGVDMSLKHNLAVILNEQAQRVDRFGFANTREGYDYFLCRIEKARQQQGAQAILVGMEPTNYFWKLLAGEMERSGQAYHLVNAYTVKKHREGDQLDRSKDDPRDSFTIADLLRTGKFTQTTLQHGQYAQLQELAKSYDRLRKELTRQQGQLWAAVGQVFPELGQAFRSFTGDTARALLQQHACAVKVRQMSRRDFLAEVRKDFSGCRMAIRKLLQVHALAQTSIGLQDGVEAVQLTIQVSLNLLAVVLEQFEQVRKALVEQFEQMPEARYLLSIPGLGVVNAALILGEIGEPQRYTTSSQWIKLAGTQPVPNRSGHKTTSRTPMSHKGRGRLRTGLYLACIRLIQINPAFQKLYWVYRKREHNPLNRMQALGVLMNKLLRITWSLIKHKALFDPAHF